MSVTHNMICTHSHISSALVVGAGRCYSSDNNRDRAIPELVLDAVERALADAALEMRNIDAVVTASVDLWDGKTASNIAVTEVVGGVMRPESRVAGDGLLAAIQAVALIGSEQYRRVLVVAHAKPNDCDNLAISNWSFDPAYQQPLAVNDLVAAGLQARAYLDHGGWTIKDLDALITRRRIAATRNLRGTEAADNRTTMALMAFAAEPLRHCDVAPMVDGAAAVIFASPAAAPIRERPVVEVAGLGYALDAHYLGDRDLSGVPALATAVRRAYRMAGIDTPVTQIDVVELSGNYSYIEPLVCEALGLSEPRAGIDYCGQTHTSNVTPSGGWWGGLPPFVAGLDRLIETTLQLRGDAGPVQVEGARVGLAHGCHGPAGQSQGVMILRRVS